MMRSDVEYSPVGEGLGMRDYWLYACLRKVAVVGAHGVSLGFTVLVAVLSRPGTSESVLLFSLNHYMSLHGVNQFFSGFC